MITLYFLNDIYVRFAVFFIKYLVKCIDNKNKCLDV